MIVTKELAGQPSVPVCDNLGFGFWHARRLGVDSNLSYQVFVIPRHMFSDGNQKPQLTLSIFVLQVALF